MTPYQKRVVTVVCRNLFGEEALAARVLDVHRAGRLRGVSRQEIIDYAHERCNLDKAALNSNMKDVVTS